MIQPHESLFIAETLSMPDCVPTVFVAAVAGPALAAFAFVAKRYFAAIDRDRARLEKFEAEKDRILEKIA